MVKLILLLFPLLSYAQTFSINPKTIVSFQENNQKITLDKNQTITINNNQLVINENIKYDLIKDGSKLYSKSNPSFTIEFLPWVHTLNTKISETSEKCSYSGYCFRCGLATKTLGFFPTPVCGYNHFKDCNGKLTNTYYETNQVTSYFGTLKSEGILIGEITSTVQDIKKINNYNEKSSCKN